MVLTVFLSFMCVVELGETEDLIVVFEPKKDRTKNDKIRLEAKKKENGFRQNFHIKKSNLSYAHVCYKITK